MQGAVRAAGCRRTCGPSCLHALFSRSFDKVTSVVQLQESAQGNLHKKTFATLGSVLAQALLPGQQGVGCRRPLTADMKGDLGSKSPLAMMVTQRASSSVEAWFWLVLMLKVWHSQRGVPAIMLVFAQWMRQVLSMCQRGSTVTIPCYRYSFQLGISCWANFAGYNK